MKIALLILASFCTINAAAQRNINVAKADYHIVSGSLFYAVNGEPVVTAKFVKLVEGTPYFKDEWMKSIVVMPNGTAYKNVPAKLNLLENTLHYQNQKGLELIAKSPVKEVVLEDEKSGELYRFFHSSALPVTGKLKEGWYQWLCSGKASLYKYFDKQLFAQKPYGSATEEQRITTKETYVILYNNTPFTAKKIKEVPGILAHKKRELEDHLKKQNDTTPLDDRFTDLIANFNSLLQ